MTLDEIQSLGDDDLQVPAATVGAEMARRTMVRVQGPTPEGIVVIDGPPLQRASGRLSRAITPEPGKVPS